MVTPPRNAAAAANKAVRITPSPVTSKQHKKILTAHSTCQASSPAVLVPWIHGKSATDSDTTTMRIHLTSGAVHVPPEKRKSIPDVLDVGTNRAGVRFSFFKYYFSCFGATSKKTFVNFRCLISKWRFPAGRSTSLQKKRKSIPDVLDGGTNCAGVRFVVCFGASQKNICSFWRLISMWEIPKFPQLIATRRIHFTSGPVHVPSDIRRSVLD